ncbi:MAG: hypothetical protein KKH04_16850 [Proteobacteria bacterium]|nr:hypothetical protein [Pseudomonadota bacterium]
MEFVEDDSKTREEVLEELKILRTRLQELEEARRVISKEKNNQAHLHAESEEELGKTREQLRDVSFKLLQAEEVD